MDKLLAPTNYNDCISTDCSYFVKNGDRFCPNCGMNQEQINILRKQESMKKATFAIFMGFGLSVMGLILILLISSSFAGCSG